MVPQFSKVKHTRTSTLQFPKNICTTYFNTSNSAISVHRERSPKSSFSATRFQQTGFLLRVPRSRVLRLHRLFAWHVLQQWRSTETDRVFRSSGSSSLQRRRRRRPFLRSSSSSSRLPSWGDLRSHSWTPRAHRGRNERSEAGQEAILVLLHRQKALVRSTVL